MTNYHWLKYPPVLPTVPSQYYQRMESAKISQCVALTIRPLQNDKQFCFAHQPSLLHKETRLHCDVSIHSETIEVDATSEVERIRLFAEIGCKSISIKICMDGRFLNAARSLTLIRIKKTPMIFKIIQLGRRGKWVLFKMTVDLSEDSNNNGMTDVIKFLWEIDTGKHRIQLLYFPSFYSNEIKTINKLCNHWLDLTGSSRMPTGRLSHGLCWY